MLLTFGIHFITFNQFLPFFFPEWINSGSSHVIWCDTKSHQITWYPMMVSQIWGFQHKIGSIRGGGTGGSNPLTLHHLAPLRFAPQILEGYLRLTTLSMGLICMYFPWYFTQFMHHFFSNKSIKIRFLTAFYRPDLFCQNNINRKFWNSRLRRSLQTVGLQAVDLGSLRSLQGIDIQIFPRYDCSQRVPGWMGLALGLQYVFDPSGWQPLPLLCSEILMVQRITVNVLDSLWCFCSRFCWWNIGMYQAISDLNSIVSQQAPSVRPTQKSRSQT